MGLPQRGFQPRDGGVLPAGGGALRFVPEDASYPDHPDYPDLGGGVLPGPFPAAPQPGSRPSQSPQPQSRGFLDTLFGSRGEPNLGLMALGAQIGGDRDAFTRFAPAIAEQRQSRATRDWLIKRGISPEDADMVAGNKDLLSHYLKPGKTDEYTARYEAGKRYGLTGDDLTSFSLTGDLPTGRFGSAEVGLQPVWGMDENGNYVLMQPSKSGKMLQSELPEGVKPLSPYDRKYQESSGAKAGGAQGEALAAIPGAQSMIGDLRLQVDSIKNDPYLGSMLGSVDYSGGYVSRSALPNLTPDAARVQSKLDQLGGGAFLQAREALRGGGPITDYESKAAERAFSRLHPGQNEKDFKEALDEFLYWAERGLAKLQATAGQTPAAIEPPASLGGGGTPPTPQTQADFDALPSGAVYTDPDDGKQYRKP